LAFQPASNTAALFIKVVTYIMNYTFKVNPLCPILVLSSLSYSSSEYPIVAMYYTADMFNYVIR